MLNQDVHMQNKRTLDQWTEMRSIIEQRPLKTSSTVRISSEDLILSHTDIFCVMLYTKQIYLHCNFQKYPLSVRFKPNHVFTAQPPLMALVEHRIPSANLLAPILGFNPSLEQLYSLLNLPVLIGFFMHKCKQTLFEDSYNLGYQ